GNPILKLLSVDVDREKDIVRSGLLGLFGKGLAVYREGTGCAAVPDGDIGKAAAFTAPPAPAAEPSEAPWPQGDVVDPAMNPALAKVLDDAALVGPGMRAVIVVKDGRIVGERY